MYGRRPVQRSCAASVWPTAQMSSRSPSTVSSEVRLDRARIDAAAAPVQRAARQMMLLEHAADRLEVELRRQIDHREIFVVELPGRSAPFRFSPVGEMLDTGRETI